MTAIGVHDASMELPKLIGRIARGEQVLLTDGGAAVAMVVAPPAAPASAVPGVRRLTAEISAGRDPGGPTARARLTPAPHPDDDLPGGDEPYLPVPLRDLGTVPAMITAGGRLTPQPFPAE